MRFRKKPVEVAAIPCADLLYAMGHDWRSLPKWASDAYEDGVIVAPTRDNLTIKTLEGDMIADCKDWIIQGIHGELYSCKPDIFDATYEVINE